MNLENTVINFLGDSITEGAGVSDIEHNRFDNVIKNKCHCKRVNNYGVSGTRIAHQTIPSDKARYDLDFCGRCWNMDKDADVVIIFGGTNDYGHGDAPLGEVGDTKRTTFCGSVDYLCRTINELYPKAVHLIITPAHCYGDNGSVYSQIKPENAERRVLKDYVEAIKSIAPKHDFYVMDFYGDLGIDPNRKEDYEKYTVDGLHFNDLGHQIIADKIIEFLQEKV